MIQLVVLFYGKKEQFLPNFIQLLQIKTAISLHILQQH